MVKISVLIVTRNAEKHILSCLKSIINQFPDNNGWELIIVDGMSKDKTRKIVEDYLKDKGVEYRVVDNPRFTLATGWNLGVSVAKGDYVVRPDAHAELLDNYILNGVAHLDKEPELVAVGGILITKSENLIGEVIAAVLSNPVGIG
jgi:putative glycosyltransferase